MYSWGSRAQNSNLQLLTEPVCGYLVNPKLGCVDSPPAGLASRGGRLGARRSLGFLSRFVKFSLQSSSLVLADSLAPTALELAGNHAQEHSLGGAATPASSRSAPDSGCSALSARSGPVGS